MNRTAIAKQTAGLAAKPTEDAPRRLGRRLRGIAQSFRGFSAADPTLRRLPRVDSVGRTSVPGLHVVGDAAGTPLLRLAMNAGARCADALARELEATSEPQPGVVDVLVVGAGAAGLACALRAHKHGLSVRVVEAHVLARTVVSMTKGKRIFAEPRGVSNVSDLWLEETTREELLARWHQAVAEARLDVRVGEPMQRLAVCAGLFEVQTPAGLHIARRVVVAVGKAGPPRRCGVPGETAHRNKLHHHVADADAVRGQRVFIYGGGDVACEAALALCGHNDVTLVTADHTLTFPTPRNRDAVVKAAAARQIELHLGARLIDFDATSCRFVDAEGKEHVLANDLVFEMLGTDEPTGLWTELGVAMEGAWTLRRYVVAVAVFLATYSLYALKKYPETPHAWPFSVWIEKDAFTRVVNSIFEVMFSPFAWMFTENARADIGRTLWFQQGYLYSLTYTVVLIVFARQALRRWTTVAARPQHQRWRYRSLVAWQVGFFFIANVVAVQALTVQHSWRAWGLYQPWPLFFHTYHWWQDSDPFIVKAFFVGAGLLGTFVVIPVLSRRHGKRFCSWVCGCGGLAETLGDRWRHLAPKGAKSRAWEFQGTVVLLAATLATAVSVGMYQTRADNPWALAYAYVVDFWLVAVIPMALYPFFGGKVWCRYWCPLAAWNQILARLYGRLGIESNDACISCGACSTQCQVGIDVMAFARRGERMDNKNTSCIQCGICIDVCPVDVLSFSTTPTDAKHNIPARRRGRPLPIVSSSIGG